MTADVAAREIYATEQVQQLRHLKKMKNSLSSSKSNHYLYQYTNHYLHNIGQGDSAGRGGSGPGHKINFNQTQTVTSPQMEGDGTPVIQTGAGQPSAEMAAFVLNSHTENNTVSFLRPVKLDGKDQVPIQVQNWTEKKDAKDQGAFNKY